MSDTVAKIVFTVDLSPYATGLKSMLSMTQQTGAQLKPLLNVDVKAPDFAGIEAELARVTKEVQDYVAELQTANPELDALNQKITDLESRLNNSSAAQEKQNVGLNKGKREALEAFGAMAFLTQGVVSLASSANGGSKDLEKLNAGMSQGISAGFGLAGVLGSLGIATGGVGVAIGATVAVGLTLLKFMDDSAERAKRLELAIKGFDSSLSGMTVGSLKMYRDELQKGVDETNKVIEERKKSIRDLEVYLAGADSGETDRIAKKLDEEKKSLAASIATRENYKSTRDIIDGQIVERQKTYAEAEKFVREMQIAAIRNSSSREKAEAKLAYDDRVRDANETISNEKQRNQALAALKQQYFNQLSEIRQREQQERIQLSNERKTQEQAAEESNFEIKLALIRKQGILLGQTEAEMELQITEAKIYRLKEQLTKELAFTDQTDPQRIAKEAALEAQIHQLEIQSMNISLGIQKQKKDLSDKLSDSEFQGALNKLQQRLVQQGKSEEEITLIIMREKEKRILLNLDEIKKSDGPLTDEIVAKQADLQQQLTEVQLLQSEKRKSVAVKEVQAMQQIFGQLDALAGTLLQMKQQSITNDLAAEESAQQKRIDAAQNAANKKFELDRKESLSRAKTQQDKDSIDQIYNARKESLDQEYADKRTALEERLDAEAKGRIRATFIFQKATQIATAMMSTYTAAALALGPPPLGLGPVFGPVVAGLAIAAGLANVALIASQEVPGYEKGGRLQKGKPGYFEGSHHEIVAPEKDFLQVFKQDLQPQLLDIFAAETHRALSSGIRPDVLSARSDYASTQKRLAMAAFDNSASSGGSSSATTEQHFHMHIETFIGEEEFVERVVKPGVESLMRRAGTDDASNLFKNPKHT